MSSCFTTIYPALADHLQATVPALGWIDLDQDQLAPENESLDYPLPYDAGVLLISFDEVSWQDRGGKIQVGEAEIRFTLARQVVQDTYTFTGQVGQQRAAALQQLQLLTDLHRALQHFAIGEELGALSRIMSRKEPVSKPGLWVYSMVYKGRLYDKDAHILAGVATPTDVAPVPVVRRGQPAAEQGGFIL
jgi:hypothetical protein